jgi:hypothetical protein
MLDGTARSKEDSQMHLLWTVLLVLSTPAVAAEVGECDTLDRVSFLVGQTKSYSGGKITTAHVDTDGEPVCCSAHLLVIIPAPELGTQCFAVSDKAGGKDGSARGFNSVAFDKIKASYDSQRGLLLTVPYTLYNDGRTGHPGLTKVRVDLRGEDSVKIER